MTYTIKKLAKMAGVTVRTLHYYDEIGLLKPAFASENGYRHYDEKELLRLQQIMFFRELEFSLEEIKEILNNSEFDINKALSEQEKMLKIEKRRIEKLIKTISKTLSRRILNRQDRNIGQVQDDSSSLKLQRAGKNKGVIMKDEELYEGFDKEEMEKYQVEAKARWGNTEAYKQSTDRVKKMGKEGIKKIQAENDEIANAIVANMDKGIESQEVQALITRHHGQISKFYDCGFEIYAGLARMYVEDERFANNYRKYHHDLPEFLSKAMIYWCKSKK